MSAWRRRRFAGLALLAASTGWAPRAGAESYFAAETSISAGFYRLSGDQDLGSYAQLATLRRQVLSTMLGGLEGRAAYCLGPHLCFGALLGVHSGPIDGRGAALLSYRASVILHLLQGKWRPFLSLSGGGLTLLSPPNLLGSDTDPAAAYSVGIDLRIAPRWRLRLDFSHIFTDAQRSGALAQNVALSAGLVFCFAPRIAARADVPTLDRDGDSVIDARDRCPDRLEDPDGFDDYDGCPDNDNDHDGLPDALDICPDRAGPRPRGCPLAAPASRPAAR